VSEGKEEEDENEKELEENATSSDVHRGQTAGAGWRKKKLEPSTDQESDEVREPVLVAPEVVEVRKWQDGMRVLDKEIMNNDEKRNELRAIDPQFQYTTRLAALEDQYKVQIVNLLEAKAAIDGENEQGFTGLMGAAVGGSTTGLKILLERKASIDHESPQGHTALISASKVGSLESIQLLIDAKATVDYETNDGRTALNQAAWCGQKEVPFSLVQPKQI